MSRTSAFISDKAVGHYKREFGYYVGFGIILALCSFLLLALPVINRGEIISFLASWMLFIAVIMALVRPAMFGRGMPDAVAGLISAFFYGFVGYIAGGANIMDIEGYRLAICIVLIFAGLSRLLVFARMLSVAVMPMQLVCFAADMLSAVLILWGFPSSRTSVIYWYAGMILLIDGAESIIEALVLSKYVEGETQDDN